ncbi:MAG: HAD-IA family hydrolase [Myxococcales bacterium FL481]|nr:MAG: HAD-IA family hydrolase [Myxococcales bacterium FL481]
MKHRSLMALRDFTVLTFDCYGTLIDWETGILAAMYPVLENHNIVASSGDILHAYARAESAVQSGAFVNYREVLRRTVSAMSHDLGFSLALDEGEVLLRSLPSWRPFPDSVSALAQLASRRRLGLISNVDDGLLRSSLTQLQHPFSFVVTSERARAYKPDERPFALACQEAQCAASQILHVAQSGYHDLVTASRLGFGTVHVRRGSRASGERATLPANERADASVDTLAELVELLGLE